MKVPPKKKKLLLFQLNLKPHLTKNLFSGSGIFLAKSSYFTNRDFPEIVPFPFPKATFALKKTPESRYIAKSFQ